MTDGLNLKLDGVLAEAKAARETAQISVRARKRSSIIAVIGTVAVLLLTASVLWVGLKNSQGVDTIIDCTTPGGSCYERQQARTSEVVQQIVESQVAAVECRDEADVRACVEQKLSP